MSQLLDVEDEQGRSSVGDPQDQPKLAMILSHLTNQHQEYFTNTYSAIVLLVSFEMNTVICLDVNTIEPKLYI